MKKIALICPKSSTIISFRMSLIQELIKRQYEVSVIAFDDNAKEVVEKTGARYYVVEDDNRSLSFFKILTLKNRLYKVLKEINPHMVFTFMLKPNIFGVLAAHKLKIKTIYSMVEGLGDAFINNTLKWKIIRAIEVFLYKMSFKHVNKVLFLQNDDRVEFLKRRIVNASKSEIINGIGVDLESFSFSEITNSSRFIMLSRLLKTKGVIEYCEAATIVKKEYPDAEFVLAGAAADFDKSTIDQYPAVQYLGVISNPKEELEKSGIFVLPSYREGMPISIIEAMAVGRPIITCCTIGCKETVIDGENGLFAKVKDSHDLAQKMIYLLKNPLEAQRMGREGRAMAELLFSAKTINNYLCNQIDIDTKDNSIRNNKVCFIGCAGAKDINSVSIKREGYDFYAPYLANSLIFKPFREIWFRLNLPGESIFYNKKLKPLDRTIIVFDSLIRTKYIKWLRKRFPNNRIILQYVNPVKNTIIPDDVIRSNCALSSCDKKDCVDYELNYLPSYYYREYVSIPRKKEYDVFFIGRDKGRSAKLFELKEAFKEQGVELELCLTAPRRFILWNNKPYYKPLIDYKQVIEQVTKSKAVLLLNSVAQTGVTLRVFESWFNQVKLITDNENVKNLPYYDKNNVFILGQDDITTLREFLDSPFVPVAKDLDKWYFDNWVDNINSFFDSENTPLKDKRERF